MKPDLTRPVATSLAVLLQVAVAAAYAPYPSSGLQARASVVHPALSYAADAAPASPSAGPARPVRNRLRFLSGIGALLAITEVTGTSTNVFLPICDQVGTVHALVAAVTNNVPVSEPFVAANYEYSPYGELLERTGDYALSCPMGFQSKYRDEETGFSYFGYRFFDSRAAQWLSHDPLREGGGFNLAAFCGGDPVNQVDPLGLETFDECMARVALERAEEDAYQGGPGLFGHLLPVSANMLRRNSLPDDFVAGQVAMREMVFGGATVPPAAVMAAPAVYEGAVALGAAANHASLSLYVRTSTALQSLAARIAAGSGLGYAFLRGVTGIGNANPEVYGARFDFFKRAQTVSSRAGLGRLAHFFRTQQVMQGQADRAAFVQRWTEIASQYDHKVFGVTYSHRWLRNTAAISRPVSDGARGIVVGANAFSTKGVPVLGKIAHEVAHSASLPMDQLPFSVQGVSEYAIGEAAASYTASEYGWIPLTVRAKLFLDAIHRIATDGEPLP